jgi:hypothetical protein
MSASAAVQVPASEVPPLRQPNPRYAELASERAVRAAAAGLESRGIHAIVVDTATEARERLLELLPGQGTVLEASSKTLQGIGLTSEMLVAKGLEPVRPKLTELMRTGRYDEARRLGAAPDAVVGSVHGITEEGQVLIASATGSQLGSYVSGAGRVIWVVGTQKIVRDLSEAERRLDEYTYPLEDARARSVYGKPSFIGKVLVVHREIVPGRVTAILVRQPLGF